MSEYHARVSWQRGEADFLDNQYSRGHLWEFDGGAIIPATASPLVIPPPLSVESNVDPEEAFVASLSSCHMLFYLSLAARQGYLIDSYVDQAVGVMGKNEQGKMAMIQVTLRPRVIYGGESKPSDDQIKSLHHQAHELCFIANSVTSEIVIDSI